MKQLIHSTLLLLSIALFAGCATMSKEECLNADWEAVGYRDGARGVHYTYLEKHRESCLKYEVIPDEAAYRSGWEQGIRSYCTTDNGYRAGAAGRAYRNICPADVAEDYLAGWEQGIEQFCTPENGLRHGLSGRHYNGVCPPHLEAGYHDFYRLGHDVRGARAEHHGIEQRVNDLERRLAVEKDPQRHRDMLHELERLQHDEARSDAGLIALEACMSSDWFDAGYRDGEDGYPRRAAEIGSVCRNYGIGADFAGYRQGWQEGNRHYCTYENGLYLGQTNQFYSGVCAGGWHQRFWQGYERGRHIYREGRYEAHPRPARRAVQSPETRRKPQPLRMEPKKPARKGVTRAIKAPEVRQKPQPAHVAPKKPVGLFGKQDIRKGNVQPEAAKKQGGIKQGREVRPAVKEQRPVIKQPHDNRDKMKQPLPEKSRKDESKRLKNGQGEMDRKKEKQNENIRDDNEREKQPDVQMKKM